MKRLLLLLACAVIPLMASAEKAEKIDAEKVMQCVRNNFPASISIRRFTMTTTGPSSEQSSLTGRIYAMLDEQPTGNKLLRAMLRIDEPPTLNGAAYLVRETEDYLRDGMFIYLPAVGRVRRVSGGLADKPLMGTEFSYFEFKQLANAFGDLNAESVRTESFSGRSTYVMRFKPLEGIETRYTSVTAWVDQKTCLFLAAEFLEGTKIIKRFTAQGNAITKTGELNYLKEVRIDDLIDGSHTIMRTDEVTLGDEQPAQYFSPKTFFLVK